MNDDILKEAFENYIDAIRDSYAMSVIDSLPNDEGKKALLVFIRNGCSPKAILDSLIELSKEENKEK